MHLKKERLILFHVLKSGGVTVYRSLARFFDRYITSHDPKTTGPMQPTPTPPRSRISALTLQTFRMSLRPSLATNLDLFAALSHDFLR